jgi:hypothetical protein
LFLEIERKAKLDRGRCRRGGVVWSKGNQKAKVGLKRLRKVREQVQSVIAIIEVGTRASQISETRVQRRAAGRDFRPPSRELKVGCGRAGNVIAGFGIFVVEIKLHREGGGGKPEAAKTKERVRLQTAE